MSLMETRVLVLAHSPSPRSPPLSPHLPSLSLPSPSSRLFSNQRHGHLFFPLCYSSNKTLRIRSTHPQSEGNSEVSRSREIQNVSDDATDDVLVVQTIETSRSESSFLAKLAIALGIAATVTFICVWSKWPTQGSTPALPVSLHGSSASASTAHLGGFTLKFFGYQIVLPEYAPGWIYFWLLMAAGCGLFVSEEALNIWVRPFTGTSVSPTQIGLAYLIYSATVKLAAVGISLARLLSLDGTWTSFAKSFSMNASYIISTILWVYWGVCISDMVPFYLGKLFRWSGASDDICSKLGIDKKKAVNITRAVQKYGNLIGFVERFSIGLRNPTAFAAGSLGISSEYFFAGVCCGGLITLPVQLAIGFFLRERPVVALAGVATIVGIWTVLPYLMAASTALFIFLRQRYSS